MWGKTKMKTVKFGFAFAPTLVVLVLFLPFKRAKEKCQKLEWQKQNGQKLVWKKQNFPRRKCMSNVYVVIVKIIWIGRT